MKRQVSIVSVALLASLSFAACSKAEKKEDPAATKPAEGDTAATAATETPPATAPAADPAAPAADPAAPAADPAAPAATATAAVKEPTAEEKALAEKAVGMLEEMAKAAETNANDCGKAATSLQAIVDKNKALIEAGKKMDNDPGKKAWFEQTYKDRMMGAMGKMMPLMEKCKDNPELLKVFTSMQ